MSLTPRSSKKAGKVKKQDSLTTDELDLHVDRRNADASSESDESDVYEVEDFGNEASISNWLEEEDEVHQEHETPPPIIRIQVPDHPYFNENKQLFLALAEVEDLNFLQLISSRQEELMKSLEIERYFPAEIIFEEGSTSLDMYFIVECDETTIEAEVEVVRKNDDDNTEKLLTRLTKGQYFGQKYFLTKRLVRPRYHRRYFNSS